MFNKIYRKKITGWGSYVYNLENPLMSLLRQTDVPYCTMYNTETGWSARYGEDGGVRLIGFQTVLGLDFRAAIVCGLLPLGEYDETKNPDWEALRADDEAFAEALKCTKDNIRFLYVACTRAKEVLHVILPENGDYSVFMKMLEDAQ